MPGNGSLELADHIKCNYRSIYAKELQISRDSLTIEILIHDYLDMFKRYFEKVQKVVPTPVVKKLVSYMKEMESHTEIIDSGEADIDTNRHIFDSLVSYKEAIYGVNMKFRDDYDKQLIADEQLKIENKVY